MFTNVKDDMDIAKNEIFGPVMSVLKFRDDRRNRGTQRTTRCSAWRPPFGLAILARPTGSPHELKAGTVWVNCYDVFDAAAPFGGFKMSGMGRELGAEGLKAYLETKTVTVAL